MHCTQCGVEAVEGAVFCHQCGARLAGSEETSPAEAPGAESTPAAKLTPVQRFAAPLKARDGDDDDAEDVLWQGQYSKLAMVSSWIGAGVFSVALAIAGFAFGFTTTGWLVALCAIALAWILLFTRLLYRQLSIHYYLTNQRLIHETGLLWREIDRIEAIDIDDVASHQGPMERLLGVGTIRIKSSDQSTPEFDMVGIEDSRKVAAMIDDVRRDERRKRGLHIETV